MEIRFGYVAMSVMLEHASPSKTVTLKSYTQLAGKDPTVALNKVRRTAMENLDNTMRLLRHNKAHGVKVFRFSSKLLPLATHPALTGWDYIEDLKDRLRLIGAFIRENKMRVSFHPDHYTLINSPREEVLLSSLRDYEYHNSLLEAMGLDERARLVTHVGGHYNDREGSIERFKINWCRVTERVAGRLTLENDDKTYTAQDVLNICNDLSLPMVLDLHHYKCNNKGENIIKLMPEIFKTWELTGLPPKIHISSPKSISNFRSHHDFVNPDDLYPFLVSARAFVSNIDVMVEAKQKDRAMFKLAKDLSSFPAIRQTGNATLIIV
ncbi:MAG: UV DNA damage repair endonuclease UvsE [Desulfotomaculaceae bacterium]